MGYFYLTSNLMVDCIGFQASPEGPPHSSEKVIHHHSCRGFFLQTRALRAKTQRQKSDINRIYANTTWLPSFVVLFAQAGLKVVPPKPFRAKQSEATQTGNNSEQGQLLERGDAVRTTACKHKTKLANYFRNLEK